MQITITLNFFNENQNKNLSILSMAPNELRFIF